MQPTQTGIAVALALTVVIAFFLFPGLSPFGRQQATQQTAAADQSQTLPAPQDQAVPPMPTQNITELSISDVKMGTGDVAQAGDTVTVTYVGALTDGTVFDASANHGNQGFSFTLGAGQVIKGWDQGIVGMKVGGTRVLAIPASLAYGDRAVGNVIPANSALIFQVELLSVQKAAK